MLPAFKGKESMGVLSAVLCPSLAPGGLEPSELLVVGMSVPPVNIPKAHCFCSLVSPLLAVSSTPSV